ncbi:MAG: phosphoribosylglycinamide synthetase [Variovorax sp.]|jgi:phosphoribosylamine--glycine ligase|nr:phosphoribosylglycinamide synthetase [Variovorax sp.]
MRILGIGRSCELGALYQRLQRAGHEVRVFVEDDACEGVFGGILHRTHDWRDELGWLRVAGDGGLALFECACHGVWQDELREQGFQVIGGSGWGDRVEADREFGQAELRRAGLRTAASHTFDSHEAASEFVQRHPARYVVKLNGADAERTRSYVGQLDDGRDVVALLHLQGAQRKVAEGASFVLMEHVQGIEVGVGAYFNGEDFLKPALLDWEHKHFFPGEQGELTGEMGTVVSYRGAGTLFESTLALLRDSLKAARHCGYVNLNLMVNERGIWPLEFTSRFGYPGYAICGALHLEGWDTLFCRMLRRDSLNFATREGFACGVVLCVPPFPYAYGYEELSKGLPIIARDGDLTKPLRDREHLHFCEVQWQDNQLLASGTTGYIGVATGTGADVGAARTAAYATASQVVVPNLRYRQDIGERVTGDLRQLAAWGHVR